MTLLFFDGLQDPILMPKPEYTAGAGVGSAATGRDGQANGAYNINSGTTLNNKVLTLSSSAATCIVGLGYYTASLGDNHYVVMFRDTTPTTQLIVYINSSGFIEVRRTNLSGTLLGTSSGHAPITASSWNHIEAKVLLHTSTGSATIRLNGLTVLTITGAVTSSTISNVASLLWNNPNAAGNTETRYDDLYVCDAVDATGTQGRANNDFLGDLRVQVLFPTSAGDTTAWTPSTGSNFAAVDETPPNSTDFVSATTSTTRDLYNVTDLTGTIVNVYAVREGLYISKTDSGTVTVKPVFKENSVVTAETGQAAAVGQFGAIHSSMRAVRPSDSAVWTSSDINALQIGEDVG